MAGSSGAAVALLWLRFLPPLLRGGGLTLPRVLPCLLARSGASGAASAAVLLFGVVAAGVAVLVLRRSGCPVRGFRCCGCPCMPAALRVASGAFSRFWQVVRLPLLRADLRGRCPPSLVARGRFFGRLPLLAVAARRFKCVLRAALGGGCVFTLPAVVGGLLVRSGVSCGASEVVRGAAVSSSAAGASGCGCGRIGAGCCPRLGWGCAGLVVLPSSCGRSGRYCRPCGAAGG